VQLLERRYTPLGRFEPGPFEGWSFLWQPALLGFIAMVLILLGGSFTNSPFKLDLSHTWFFGEPSSGAVGTPSLTKLILAIVLMYGGLLLLMRVWLRLAEVLKLHPGRVDQDAVVDAAYLGDTHGGRAAALFEGRL